MNNLLGSNTTLSSPACAICKRTDYDQGPRPMVKTRCQPEPHYFHKVCIYDSWHNSTAGEIRERSCYVCKKTKPKLFDVNCLGKQAEPGTLTERPATNISPQDSAPQVRMLFDAAEKGDLESLQDLIDQKVNINAKSEHGTTPLHIATCNGYSDIVQALIYKRVELLDILKELGHLALGVLDVLTKCRRIDCDNILAIVNIIKLGEKLWSTVSDSWSSARVNAARTTNGETPLHIATGRRNFECLILLIGYGGKVNTQLKTTGETPLHIAARNGDLNCLKVLAGYILNTEIHDTKDTKDTEVTKDKDNFQTICDSIIFLIENYQKGNINIKDRSNCSAPLI